MNADFYVQNRRRLLKEVNSSVVVMAGNDALQKAADIAYEFQQDANFLYVTGIREAGWKLIMDEGVSYLVSPNRDDTYRVFNGGLSTEDAVRVSGVDKILNSREANALLRQLARKHNSVASVKAGSRERYYDFHVNPGPKKLYAKLRTLFGKVEDARPVLSRLRAIKQPVEIDQHRKAIAITIESLKAVSDSLAGTVNERDIAAKLTYDFMVNGAVHAYEPIVASGENACTLHYVDNNKDLPSNSLLLIDAGAASNGYCADITRTYALGSPSERQQQIHSAVQKAHNDIIDLIKPGLLFANYQKNVDKIMLEALKSVDLLPNIKAYRTYFPHAVSHGLGVDVHESLGGYKAFAPGMIITVEPGIYVKEEGIGVRIEDDILVTKDGCENLSAALTTAL